MKFLRILKASLVLSAPFSLAAGAVVVDHTYDREALVPEVVAELVRRAPVLHIAYRSDGSAITWGMKTLFAQRPEFVYSAMYAGFPRGSTGLRVWYGMRGTDYIPPELYWDSHDGTEALGRILTENPAIRYTTWSWCSEHASWTDEDQDRYFQKMDSLEKVFPAVTFIWQTGAGRSVGGRATDARQAIFNERLRTWVKAHDKVLFDFEDLDTWHRGTQNRELRPWNGSDTLVAVQHPAWAQGNGPETGFFHANDSMGIDKGWAFWYLIARLEGLVEARTARIGSGIESSELRRDGSDRIVRNARAGWLEMRDLRGGLIRREAVEAGLVRLRPAGSGLALAKLPDGTVVRILDAGGVR